MITCSSTWRSTHRDRRLGARSRSNPMQGLLAALKAASAARIHSRVSSFRNLRWVVGLAVRCSPLFVREDQLASGVANVLDVFFAELRIAHDDVDLAQIA